MIKLNYLFIPVAIFFLNVSIASAECVTKRACNSQCNETLNETVMDSVLDRAGSLFGTDDACEQRCDSYPEVCPYPDVSSGDKNDREKRGAQGRATVDGDTTAAQTSAEAEERARADRLQRELDARDREVRERDAAQARRDAEAAEAARQAEAEKCQSTRTENYQTLCVRSDGSTRVISEDVDARKRAEADEKKALAMQEVALDVQNLETELKGACGESRKKAAKCCAAPQECIGEALGASKDTAGFAMGAIQMIAGGAIAASQNRGIASMCNTLGDVAKGGAVLSTALAFTCNKHAESCKSECGDVMDKAERNKATRCNVASLDPATKANCISSYDSLIDNIDKRIGQCEQFDSATVQQGMNAISNLYAAKMSDSCKKATSSNVVNLEKTDFNVDCSTPAGKTNPVCQNPCMRDPTSQECASTLASLGNQNGGGPGLTNGGNDGYEDSLDLGDPDAGENAGVNGGPAAGQSKLAGAQGSGGGGGLPGGGGAGGGSDGDGGGSRSSGVPNGIIQGTRSGNGYSPSYARSGSSGGYSGSKRGPASEGKGFNLKDYLPGGKLAPKRSIASLSGHPEIAPKTSNIFQRISARYREVCLKNRLYECDKLVVRRR